MDRGTMNRLFLLLILVSFSLLEARIVDGIAMIVEGEAITTAEIRAVRSQMRVNKAKAMDLLIQDRLQKVAMKEIVVSEEEVDTKIAEIAKQNKITLPKMQRILKQQGTSWVQYRTSMRESLKKVHFYQDVVVASIPEPTEDELKLFYQEHRRQFTVPKRIRMTQYRAKTQKALQTFIQTKKKKTVHIKSISKETKSLDTELLSILLHTPKNRYTKILNTGDGYIMYKVRAVWGKRIMPFALAQSAITVAWKQAQQSKALEDYFKKLRTRADIQILR